MKKMIFILLAGAMMFASCEKEQLIQEPDVDGGNSQVKFEFIFDNSFSGTIEGIYVVVNDNNIGQINTTNGIGYNSVFQDYLDFGTPIPEGNNFFAENGVPINFEVYDASNDSLIFSVKNLVHYSKGEYGSEEIELYNNYTSSFATNSKNSWLGVSDFSDSEVYTVIAVSN